MKKFFLLLLISVCGMIAHAKNYEINVGGIEVTSNNYNNVTGGNITVTSGCSSGQVRYDANKNELYLYNITITRTGSSNYGIHNRKCDNLTITLTGECYITCEAEAMVLQRATKINLLNGNFYLRTTNSGKSAINASGVTVNFLTEYYAGSSTIYISNSSSTKSTIGGDQAGVIDFQFMKGNDSYDHKPHIYINNTQGYALKDHMVNFRAGCDVHINYSSSYQGIYNCILSIESPVAILTPNQGYMNNPGNSGTIVDSSGSPAKELYISDDYVAIINSTNFPDTQFRNYLLNSAGYSKGYLMQSDIDARSAFNLNTKGIYNLKGIEYFTELVTLDCANNYLATLDLSNNYLIKELDCSRNLLTSLNVCNTFLEKLLCYSNRFSQLNLSDYSKLKILDCHNNPYLTSLLCTRCALTTLNVSSCASLREIICSRNSLTSLNVQGLSSLKTLYCSNNKLTSLSVQGCSALQELWCIDNQIKESAMGTLVNSLRTIPETSDLGKFVAIQPGNAAEGNVITAAQVLTVTKKRWRAMQLTEDNVLEDIPLRGDVNRDGKINVSDVTTLVNMILGVVTMDQEVADVNGDGKVNVSDVTALINLILA